MNAPILPPAVQKSIDTRDALVRSIAAAKVLVQRATPPTIAEQIQRGDCDDQLHSILEAYKVRRDILSRKVIRSLDRGDRVCLNASARDLAGCLGTVQHVNVKTVSVHLDKSDAAGRYSDRDVRVPASMLSPVSA